MDVPWPEIHSPFLCAFILPLPAKEFAMKTPALKVLSLIIVLGPFATLLMGQPASTLFPVNFTCDFEEGNLTGWVRSGTAFDDQPTFGDNPTARNRGPSNHRGNWWIGTFENYQNKRGQRPGQIQGDNPRGTLTSSKFTIPPGTLTFLIGGGSSFETRVELMVIDPIEGDIQVFHASGGNTETMQPVKWDLGKYANKTGFIRIVDESSDGWGHINVDDFRFENPVNKNNSTDRTIRVSLTSDKTHVGVNDEIKFTAAINESLQYLEFFFDFGDSQQTEWIPTPDSRHIYNSPGTFTVQVQVRQKRTQQVIARSDPISILVENQLRLPVPARVTATDGAFPDRIQVNWVMVRSATGYAVYRSETNNTADAIVIGNTASPGLTDENISAGKTYYYWIKALRERRESLFSSPDSGFARAPVEREPQQIAAPEGVAATDGAFPDRIQVNWVMVRSATGYAVYRSETNNTTDAIVIGNTASLSLTDENISAGKTYYYWVKALREKRESLYSTPDSGYALAPVEREPQQIAAPEGITATDGAFPDKIQVNWNAVPSANEYIVYRSETNNSADATFLDSTTSLSVKDENISAGKKYYYWVKALRGKKESLYSSPDSGFALAPRQIAAPTEVTATDGTIKDRIQVNWNTVPSATGYAIYRSETNNTADAIVIGNTASPGLTDENISAGKTYNYWVKALRGNLESPFSSPDSGFAATSVERASTPPSPPKVWPYVGGGFLAVISIFALYRAFHSNKTILPGNNIMAIPRPDMGTQKLESSLPSYPQPEVRIRPVPDKGEQNIYVDAKNVTEGRK